VSRNIHLGGASALIVVDGKVVLIRRGKEPFRNHWSLPGGSVQPKEHIRDAVKREVREETGLDVVVGRVASYSEVIAEREHFVVLAFHCSVVGGELRAGDDALEAEFVHPMDLGDKTTTPGLEDVLRDAGLLDER
jgi:8-oxo-dGTP diphosphatase